MSKLAELLTNLGKDAALHDEYVEDPEAVMSRHDLTEEERHAMLQKDIETLKRLSGLDRLKSNSTIKAY